VAVDACGSFPGGGKNRLFLPDGSSFVLPTLGTEPPEFSGYVEKVRPQLLFLRQLGRSRLFSALGCRQLPPVLATISDLSFVLYLAASAHYSPNGSFLSRALDSGDLVRLSKFEFFEWVMNFNAMGFWSSLGEARAGDSQPASRASNRTR
jgi:hypothetical protein